MAADIVMSLTALLEQVITHRNCELTQSTYGCKARVFRIEPHDYEVSLNNEGAVLIRYTGQTTSRVRLENIPDRTGYEEMCTWFAHLPIGWEEGRLQDYAHFAPVTTEQDVTGEKPVMAIIPADRARLLTSSYHQEKDAPLLTSVDRSICAEKTGKLSGS